MKSKTPLIFLLFCILSCKENVKHTENVIADRKYKYDSIFDKDKRLVEVRKFRDKELELIEFFNEKESLRKIIKYMKVDNKIYPNQFIEIDENGDTVKSESLYYDLYCVKDTISRNEKYEFKVVLTGRLFDSAQIYLCNYDQNFNLDTSNTLCDIFPMPRYEAPLSTPAKKIGWNYVRGKIDNYQNYKNSKGKDSSVYASIYLLDSFYVKQ